MEWNGDIFFKSKVYVISSLTLLEKYLLISRYNLV